MSICIAVVASIWWYGRAAADVDPRALLEYRPPQVTRVLARDGTLIGELHEGERRTLVAHADLPPRLIDAFLAAEDADFFQHDGLDWPSIGRAIVANILRGEIHQGASTITQQVIKNTLLVGQRGITRKSQELILAGRVEAAISKTWIFTIYVNEIYFGEGRYGVVEAARYCFAKPLAELDLGQLATLAALPNAPGVVTCRRRTERLAARRDYVLRQMVEHELATADEIAPFLGQPIVAADLRATRAAIGEADEFVELARRELDQRYGEHEVTRLGATVWTTVDLDLQRTARAAGQQQLEALEARRGHGHGVAVDGVAAGRDAGPQLAVVLADVERGELLALIGGREFRRGAFDRSHFARRDPGGVVEPRLFAAALRGRSGGGPGPAFGAVALSPIELLTAYLAVARGGDGVAPTGILTVEIPPGLDGAASRSEAVARERFGIEPALAGQMTRGLIVEPPEGLRPPVAGKSGTSDQARDAWFAGYTRAHVVVTWVGFDQPTSLGHDGSGSSLALPIALAVVARASGAPPVAPSPGPGPTQGRE